MSATQPRPRVLISAFACEPGRGSEQEVGWRWACEMSRWFDVTLVTQTRNRPGIEREIAKGFPEDHSLSFEYHQLPQPVYRLKSRFDPLTWPYYILWQWSMIGLARRLHEKNPFVLAHHVTFVSFRVPVHLKRLGIPVIFGPVGGAERAPLGLLVRGFGPLVLAKELLRNLTTSVCSRMLRVWRPIPSGRGVCLATTPGMEAIFRRAGFPVKLFPAIGIEEIPGQASTASDPSKGMRYLYVGRLHPLKGVRLLLEAFARAAVPGSRLTLVGGGKEEPVLRKLAVGLGIGDRVEWVGKVPRERLPAIYRNHHVLVAPSLYESGGLTALEAMSEGVPVIALDVGGHSVSIGEGCGIKIPCGGGINMVVSHLAEAMCQYARNPQLVSLHGRAARDHVAARYGWQHKSEAMKEIYEDLISSAPTDGAPLL